MKERGKTFAAITIIFVFLVGLLLMFRPIADYGFPKIMVNDILYERSHQAPCDELPSGFTLIGTVEKEEKELSEMQNFSSYIVASGSEIYGSESCRSSVYVHIEGQYVHFVSWEVDCALLNYQGRIYMHEQDYQNHGMGKDFPDVVLRPFDDTFVSAGTLAFGEQQTVPEEDMTTSGVWYARDTLFVHPQDPSTVYVEEHYDGTTTYVPFFLTDSVPIDVIHLSHRGVTVE